MVHISLDDLARSIRDAEALVRLRGHYAHYKHPDQVYEVRGFAILEATDEIAVRYAPLSDANIEFVRPLDSWLEAVERNGESIPRFSLVE